MSESKQLNRKAGDFVVVKGIGAAKIDEICEGTYFMFFASGKKGQGWLDKDIEKSITEKQFWAEWREAKRFH